MFLPAAQHVRVNTIVIVNNVVDGEPEHEQ